MKPERYQLIKKIFMEARVLSGDDRGALLDRECGNDPDLRAHVEKLLADEQQATEFLETPVVPAGAWRDGVSDDDGVPIPERIGRYRIIRKIGAGGMGAVYEAEQESPKRTVALKVIRPDCMSPAALRRFEYETHVLGRLQHPGIAQIFEADTFDTGRGTQPFFAMELIAGKPLLEFANHHKLSTRQRLELIARICEAVQHAHQRGVIHRDLKPGNIIVDGAGQPKILDFGVARATDSDLQATTLRTDVGQLIGTIPYMSPEQVAADPDDLDTRSDVYALGIVAYELLAGRLPYDLSKKMVFEVARVIREDDPTPLSSINRFFRGDIETIVAKAMEKDKGRRYQSPNELGSDIQRYLRDEPIVARPVSGFYQLRKFAKRNKALAAGSVVGAVGLVVGTTLALLFAAGQARARLAAVRQASIAEAVSGFLNDDILAQSNPYRQPSPDVRLRDILDDAVDRIDRKLNEQPLVAASVKATAGQVYMNLDQIPLAEKLLREALAIYESEPEYVNQNVAQCIHGLAQTLQTKRDFQEANVLYERSLAMWRQLEGDYDTEIAVGINGLGEVAFYMNDLPEAERLIRSAVGVCMAAESPDPLLCSGVQHNLTVVLQARGKRADAEAMLVENLAEQRRNFGDDNPLVAWTLNELGMFHLNGGDPATGEPFLRESRELRMSAFGEAHRETVDSSRNLAQCLGTLGRWAETEVLLREVLRLYRPHSPEDGYPVLDRQNLAISLARQRKNEEAEEIHRQVLDLAPKVKGGEANRWQAINGLSKLMQQTGRIEEAEQYSRESIKYLEEKNGWGHWRTLHETFRLTGLLNYQGKFAEVEDVARSALERRGRTRPESDRQVAVAFEQLGCERGFALFELGRFEEARPWLDGCLTFQRNAKIDGKDIAVTESRLGGCLTTLGRFQEAEPLLIGSYPRIKNEFANTEHATKAIRRIVTLYEAWGKPEAVAQWRAKLPAQEAPPSTE